MSDSDDDEFRLYHYTPSLALAIISTVVFGILTIAHIHRMIRTRSWFCIPFIVGGIFETLGYVGRIISSNNRESLGPFIMQTLLILLGPALFAASVYMCLSRIILAVRAPHLSVIRVAWQTKLFVSGDVLVFLVQCGGGGLQASGDASTINLGQNITIAGLFLQLLFFGTFMIIGGVFHRRCIRNPTAESLNRKMPWQRMMFMLYVASGLILVRSIFRVVEYIQGRNGYLLSREWPTYVFDALLMAATMLVFLIWYPSTLQRCLVGISSEGFEELATVGADADQSRRRV
jgi:hypothetical protein